MARKINVNGPCFYLIDIIYIKCYTKQKNLKVKNERFESDYYRCG